MTNLLMLMLSIVTAALLGGTLVVFFVRLRQIEDAFWGRERKAVTGEQVDDASPGSTGGDTRS